VVTRGRGASGGRLHLPLRDVDREPQLVYGPVDSLRYGRSLGINLLPTGEAPRARPRPSGLLR